MDTRECAKADCPYRFSGLSASGKRTGLCSMPKPLMGIGCPGLARKFKAQ
ncbi:MAG TPA: hypothetical protein VMC84_00195 [Methanocella sp.]|nr:hypothetical protein [Methanocella sp.]HTY89575.1 hypothetical protein [Methanocella sp.]